MVRMQKNEESCSLDDFSGSLVFGNDTSGMSHDVSGVRESVDRKNSYATQELYTFLEDESKENFSGQTAGDRGLSVESKINSEKATQKIRDDTQTDSSINIISDTLIDEDLKNESPLSSDREYFSRTSLHDTQKIRSSNDPSDVTNPKFSLGDEVIQNGHNPSAELSPSYVRPQLTPAILSNGDQTKKINSRDLNTPPHNNVTRVIGPLSNVSSDSSHGGQIDENADQNTRDVRNDMEIPNTIERDISSRRQVLNTQEDLEQSHTNSYLHLSQEEYSSRKGSQEVINSEEEKGSPSLDEIGKDNVVYIDDSILTYNHRKKYRSQFSRREDEEIGLRPQLKRPSSNDDDRLKDVEGEKNHLPGISPSIREVEESSPLFIKKADILTRNSISGTTSERAKGDSSKLLSESGLMSSPTGESTPCNKTDKTGDDRENGRKRDPSDETSSYVVKEEFSKRRRCTIGSELSQQASVKGELSGLYNDSDILTAESSSTICYEDGMPFYNVWAHYNLKWYCGIIRFPGIERSQVDFEDGLFEMKNSDLFLLDIRVGDTLKIKSSRPSYIVTGLLRKPDNSEIKCLRGYNYVILRRQNSKVIQEREVHISECCLEVSDWIHHQEKFHLIYNGSNLLQSNGIGDFLLSRESKSMEIDKRLSSDLSKAYASDDKPPTLLSSPTKNMDRLISSPSKGYPSSKRKLFSNSLFFLTSLSEDKKNELRDLIVMNDGILLEEGLDKIVGANSDSQLSPRILDSFKFCALVSDTHYRSAKYLQALALGWPIVSEIFIHDCVNGISSLSSWPSYLLPAGHSSVLNSIKSQDVYQFRLRFEKNRGLVDQLSNNSEVLGNFHIFFFQEQVSEITLRTCNFVFLSFGAKAYFFSEREKLIEGLRRSKIKNSENILIYDDTHTLKSVLSELVQARTYNSKLLKRKPSRRTRGTDKSKESEIFSFRAAMIDWEWVVQCVIGGFPWSITFYDFHM